MASHVFLSYASRDREIAETVCAALEAGGIPCWMAPRNILPGSDYGASIIEALEAAQAMVLIFSSHSNVSPHIKREIERAVNKGIAIIPFRIENVMPSKTLEYFISTQHWLDAYTPPLERHLQHLVDTMRVLLTQVVPHPVVREDSLVREPESAGPSPKVSQVALAGSLSWKKVAFPGVVALILIGAVVAGLTLRSILNRGITPSRAPLETGSPKSKVPEYPPAVKYNLERAQSAPNNAEKLVWINKALELQPDLAEAYNARGILQVQMGHETQALQDFNQAISLAPRYYRAYNNRGNLYFKWGELTQALADYNEALKLNADYVPAYVNRGNLYRRQGLTEPALADYNRAISLKSNEGEAYLNRALLYEANKEPARALEDFQKAIALMPQNFAAYHGRGYLRLKQGNLDAALADLNQAITLKAEAALAYRHRGQVYLQKGDHARAQSDFKKARELQVQEAQGSEP